MIAWRPKTTWELVRMRPVASMITPDPTARLTRSVVWYGLIAMEEIETTAGETRS